MVDACDSSRPEVARRMASASLVATVTVCTRLMPAGQADASALTTRSLRWTAGTLRAAVPQRACVFKSPLSLAWQPQDSTSAVASSPASPLIEATLESVVQDITYQLMGSYFVKKSVSLFIKCYKLLIRYLYRF